MRKATVVKIKKDEEKELIFTFENDDGRIEAVISEYVEKGWFIVYRKTKTIWKTYTFNWWQFVIFLVITTIWVYIWNSVLDAIWHR